MHRWLKNGLVIALLLGTAFYALAEDITLTTYYPSPRGVYQELKTAGDMVVGNISNAPGARLHVIQDDPSSLAPVFRADDETSETSPFLIDANGNVGIGTAAPVLTTTGPGMHIQGAVPTIRLVDTDAGGMDVRLVVDAGQAQFVTPTQPQAMVLMPNGNVGIGAAPNPAFSLDITGSVNATDIFKNGLPLETVPVDAVMFFARDTCPPGWSAYGNGLGRYIVGGLPPNIEQPVGIALSDLEERPVGEHSHFGMWVFNTLNPGATGRVTSTITPTNPFNLPSGAGGDHGIMQGTTSSGPLGPTPAPYIQLLVCRKD